MKATKSHGGDADLALFAANAHFALAGTFFASLPQDVNAQAASLQSKKQLGKLIAATTNLAFAMELFLKGLSIKMTGKAQSGHDLEKLFLALPAVARNSIEARYQTRLKRDRDKEFPGIEVRFSPATMIPAKGKRLDARQRDVLSLLTAEKNAFEMWRYLHEQVPPARPVSVVVNYYRIGMLVNAIQDQFKPPDKRP
jgi:hypothetical protein